jgi:hypothetical protein
VELLDSILARLRAADDISGRAEFEEIATALVQHFADSGVPHVSEMLDLWLSGWTWPEIADRIGKEPKAANKDFWRWFRRGLRHLNLM